MLRSKRARLEKNDRIDTMGKDSPLGLSLGELMGCPVPLPVPDETSEPEPSTPPASPSFSRVVLQRTRAGCGGKWVTRVLLTPPPASVQLEALARELRKGLGAGAHTEEGVLVVQGDIADRIADWFRKRGVPRIVR